MFVKHLDLLKRRQCRNYEMLEQTNSDSQCSLLKGFRLFLIACLRARVCVRACARVRVHSCVECVCLGFEEARRGHQILELGL